MTRHPGVESSASAPIDDPLDGLLGYQLRRASHAMLDDLASVLDDFSIRPTAVSVILLVASNPGISQSRLGQILAIKRANMAPMAAKLTEQGLLTRSRVDGRSHGLHLTAEGKTVVVKIRKRVANHEERFWKGTNDADRSAILTFLKSLWEQPK
jgi:DNA-binding MarR family transcriptional regulator